MSDAKGDDFVKQANKKMDSWTILPSSTQEKYEAAVDLLDKAAAQYKISSNCKLSTLR